MKNQMLAGIAAVVIVAAIAALLLLGQNQQQPQGQQSNPIQPSQQDVQVRATSAVSDELAQTLGNVSTSDIEALLRQ